MCGIAGFSLRSDPAGEASFEALVAMTRALVHRGPDDEGYYCKPGEIGLGSRRLSIIDLSPAGRMPLYNESRSIAAIQNGEIYNFQELREQLVGRGHRFSSRTDTEVVVHLYEDFGERCFEKLDGMYAIALWDESRRRLLLARDRFGEKPLYYFENGGTLAFSSELRSFAICPFFRDDLDWAALDQFLTLGYIMAPATPYIRARKLLPGHYLIFDQTKGESTIRPYWSPPHPHEAQARKTEAEYLAEFDRIFAESVRSRMVSDVPVGAFLSGGIDSSLVVAAMARLQTAPIRTFSIGFSGSGEHNENPVAEEVARSLGVTHETLHLQHSEILPLIEKLPELSDEPIGDLAFLCIYLITKSAKQKGITVMLSGDGGDELFLGYPIYRWVASLKSAYTVPRYLRYALAAGVGFAGRMSQSSRLSKAAHALQHLTLEEASYYLTSYGAWSVTELRRLKRDRELSVNVQTFLSAFHLRNNAVDCQASALLATYLCDNNLARMDRASMANAVETRAPFLKPALLEFSDRLPFDMKIRGPNQKYILRRALARSVPETIVNRPKHGFNAIPMAAWLRKELSSLTEAFLEPAFLQSQGIFDADYAAQIVREHRQGGRFNHWWKLWLMLVLQMWLRARSQRALPSMPKIDSTMITSADRSSAVTNAAG
jgi:asparagine synthase (glutamine-hydrolysing)